VVASVASVALALFLTGRGVAGAAFGGDLQTHFGNGPLDVAVDVHGQSF
jgi:hypothetical protein